MDRQDVEPGDFRRASRNAQEEQSGTATACRLASVRHYSPPILRFFFGNGVKRFAFFDFLLPHASRLKP
jgi:hypothetical protein